jgi:DNA/RNA endonuclease YhcR with UshA esterase domain
MRMKLACLVAGVGLLLATTPVSTHHAFSAEFDVEKPLTLKGKLVKWDMINPHSWFHLDIEDDDGTVVTWSIEGGSPNELIRNGVTKNTLAIGTVLTVEGYHAKDGTPKGVGRNFTLEDGGRLFLGGSANRISAEK